MIAVHKSFHRNPFVAAAVLLLLASALPAKPARAAEPGRKPLKIFILAGQSNMEGHAKISTFGYIGEDPKTAPILKEMLAADGKPKVCDDVWMSYFTGGAAAGGNGEGLGRLTAGFGARRKFSEPGDEIGPEFTFGIYMHKAVKEPILIIKTAWGGKSLFLDYRPPSAGPYVLTEADLQKKATSPEAKKELETKMREKTGVYYHLMVDHVKAVLKDIKHACPDYDPQQGFEVAGFVWFQGFNDLVSHNVYWPSGAKQPDYSNYSKWLADFIRDVRKDIDAPKMPFVIGVLGVDGLNASAGTKAFRRAMAAPAALPEFQGNVVAVETAPFWDEALGAIDKKKEQVRSKKFSLKQKVEKGTMTKAEADAEAKKYEAELISPAEAALFNRGASNGGYHYLGCAKTFALIGKAFAEALCQMEASDTKAK
jgi:alpha-galactosidase